MKVIVDTCIWSLALRRGSSYRSLDDALKLDDVRDALRRGDIKAATHLARVYTLTPVAM